MTERPDVTEGVDGYARCPECEHDGRMTLTTLPICQRCYNMHSPHKEQLPCWSKSGEAVR